MFKQTLEVLAQIRAEFAQLLYAKRLALWAEVCYNGIMRNYVWRGADHDHNQL